MVGWVRRQGGDWRVKVEADEQSKARGLQYQEHSYVPWSRIVLHKGVLNQLFLVSSPGFIFILWPRSAFAAGPTLLVRIGCELHLEVVPRPLSTLSSKGFYFLWQRMPLACCSRSLPWLTPHDSPNARTASLCIWRVTTVILHRLGLQPRSVAWPLESSVSCQGLCLHFATCSCWCTAVSCQRLRKHQDLRNPWQEALED